jgi:hypothetical protein
MMSDFLERVLLQRQAEQMRLESGPLRRLACRCGRRLKPTNTTGQCVPCETGVRATTGQPEASESISEEVS